MTASDPPPNPSAPDASMPPAPRRSSTAAIIAVVVVVLIIVGGVAVAYMAHVGPFATSNGGCSGTQGTISGAGSTFVFPLMNAWSMAYLSAKCVQVNYQSVGSGTGITDLTSKLVGYGASDAPLSATQRAALPGPAFTIPEAAGAVVITYNVPGVSSGLNLTGAIIASIYLGAVTSWNDSSIQAANPHTTLPDQAIVVVHRSDGSGTSFAFTSYLSAESSTWASTVGKGTTVVWPAGIGAKGSTGVAGEVALTTGAIGYVELTYALLNNIGYANIQNPAGTFVKANVTTTQAAVAAGSGSLPPGSGDWYNVTLLNEPGTNTYPIATFTYLMVYGDLGAVYGSDMTQGQATQLVQFLWWVVHDGQATNPTLFFVPLPANVVSLDETTIGQITYNGGALTSH